SRGSAPAATSWWRTSRDRAPKPCRVEGFGGRGPADGFGARRRRAPGGERPARRRAAGRGRVVRPRPAHGGPRGRVVGGPGAAPPRRVSPLLRRGAAALAGRPGGGGRPHPRA